MPKKSLPDIDDIISNKWLVHFDRKPIDKHLLYGFVLACNEDLTFLNIFDNSLFLLDGYCVFRNKDVRGYAVYDHENYFLSEVIKYKQISPVPQPSISISSWSDVLSTVSKSFPLIVIDQECIDPDVCYVGKLKEIKRRSFVICDIDPDAEWNETRSYKFGDLTKLKFGGRYENTLALVNESRPSQ